MYYSLVNNNPWLSLSLRPEIVRIAIINPAGVMNAQWQPETEALSVSVPNVAAAHHTLGVMGDACGEPTRTTLVLSKRRRRRWHLHVAVDGTTHWKPRVCRHTPHTIPTGIDDNVHYLVLSQKTENSARIITKWFIHCRQCNIRFRFLFAAHAFSECVETLETSASCCSIPSGCVIK